MNLGRAAAAGTIATATMTALWLIEPSIGLRTIAMGQMLSTAMSASVAHLSLSAGSGWAIHFLVGIALTLVYVALLDGRLPGPPAARGAVFGVMVFVVAQLAFMPLVGAGVFSRGDVALLAGSLLGHLVYGVTAAWVYGDARASATTA